MGPLWIMLKNVLLFVALAVPGYVFVKKDILKAEQSSVLSKILLYVGVPFMVMTSTMNVELSGELALGILTIFALGAGMIVLLFALSKPIWKREQDLKKQGMLRFCSIFSNNGFLGIPLAVAVFGSGSAVAIYVVVLNILSNMAMYTLGVYLIAADKKAMHWKKALFSPVVIGFFAGLVCNWLDVKTYVPEVFTYANYFNGIVTPFCMTILGMKLGNVKFSSLLTDKRMYKVAALKLLAVPVSVTAILLGVHAIVPIGSEMILGAFIAFGTPTAAVSSMFSDAHDGDTESAVKFTLGATMLCIVTIPILYALLCMIL